MNIYIALNPYVVDGGSSFISISLKSKKGVIINIMRQKTRTNNKNNSSSSGGGSNGKRKKVKKRKLVDGEQQHKIRRQTTGITVMAVREAAPGSASASASATVVTTTAPECDSINKITFFSRLSESILDEKGNVSVVTCTIFLPFSPFCTNTRTFLYPIISYL